LGNAGIDKNLAKQAKNKELEADAVEIRMRATRRVDEMIEKQRETVGLAQGRRSDLGCGGPQVKATLGEAGIDKNLAHQARGLGRLSVKAFEAAVERARDAINNIVKIHADRDARLAKIAEISEGNLDLSLARRYPIIYADPPWKYEAPPMGAGNRSIENHYPTMSLAEICALPVAREVQTPGSAAQRRIFFSGFQSPGPPTAPPLASLILSAVSADGFCVPATRRLTVGCRTPICAANCTCDTSANRKYSPRRIIELFLLDHAGRRRLNCHRRRQSPYFFVLFEEPPGT
jgi:hypothetical protein